MATHITVSRPATIEHLDATSATHASDKLRSAERREALTELRATHVDPAVKSSLKFPCLGGGLLLHSDGREMTPAEHRSLLLRLVRERSYYYREELRSDGRCRLRRRPTRGVRNLAVTFRPDYAALLSAISALPQGGAMVRRAVVGSARMLATEFTSLTGLDVVACEVHPESSVLHVHLTYTTVDANNRLRSHTGSRGRKGIRCLGPWHVGTLRLCAAGYLPEGDGRLANTDRQRVLRMHGTEPVDWALSAALDARCQQLVEQAGLQQLFAAHAQEYQRGLLERRAMRPRRLSQALEAAAIDRESLRREAGTLRAQLRAANQLLARTLPRRKVQTLGDKPLIRSL